MGADINAVNDNDECSFHYAAQGGDIEMVDFLITEGANTELVDDNERTAKQRACVNRRTAVAGLIHTETVLVRRERERVRRRELRISDFLAFAMGNHGRFRENSCFGLLGPCIMSCVMDQLRILDNA